MGQITYTPLVANYITNDQLNADDEVGFKKGLNTFLNSKNNVLEGIIKGLNQFYEKSGQGDINIGVYTSSETIKNAVVNSLGGIIYDTTKNIGLKFNNKALVVDLTTDSTAIAMGRNLQLINLFADTSTSQASAHLMAVDLDDNSIFRLNLTTSSPATSSEYSSEFITTVGQASYGKLTNLTKTKVNAIKDVYLESNVLKVKDKEDTIHSYDLISFEKKYFHSVTINLHKLSTDYNCYIVLDIIADELKDSETGEPLADQTLDMESFIENAFKGDYNKFIQGIAIKDTTGEIIGTEFNVIIYNRGEENEYYYAQVRDIKNPANIIIFSTYASDTVNIEDNYYVPLIEETQAV